MTCHPQSWSGKQAAQTQAAMESPVNLCTAQDKWKPQVIIDT